MYTTPSIVFGFHGCDQSVADLVLHKGNVLAPSEEIFDWLGHGIYFWEGSESRALEWAKSKQAKGQIEKPAVVGAIIKLGNCLDLLDDRCIKNVSTTFKILKQEFEEIGETLPLNKAKDQNGISFCRELDCKVIERLHQLNSERIADNMGWKSVARNKKRIQTHPDFIDSVRGMFPEGDHLYPEAGFRAYNHIQLCVVNPNCILGYFKPRSPNTDYKVF
jgi:hypothetical protein